MTDDKPAKRDKNANLKPWKPGQTGNPDGRPPLPPVLKEAKRLNKTTLEEIINEYLWAPIETLQRDKDDGSIPTVKSWMIAIMLKGRTTGDWSGYEWIAQRLLGKVKEQIEHTQPVPFVVRHLDGSQTVLGAKVEKPDGSE